MGKYRTGYLPSPPHKLGLGNPTHLRASGALPASASVPLGPVVDQGITSSCTGNSSAVAIQAAAGQPWEPLPSRLWLYTMARAKSGQLPLSDEGTYIHAIFEAAADLGFPPESVWPFSEDPAKVNAMPDWEANREALDQKYVTGAYRITSIGQMRVLDVQSAIAAGHAVVWGTDLDEAFMDLGPHSVWPGVRGSVVGGHAMVLHAYRTNSVGKLEFASRSSWGEGYADGGSAWVSEAAVASQDASDFWVVAVAPRFPTVVA